MQNATKSTPFPTPAKAAVSDTDTALQPPSPTMTSAVNSTKAPAAKMAAPAAATAPSDGNVRSNASKHSGHGHIARTVTTAALFSTVVFAVFW
jgi:hypothetical protein